MNPKCIDAVKRASSRPLTSTQVKSIEDSISSTMRRLARTDPERWRTLTNDQRMAEAADAAMADMQAMALRKLNNAERQIVKTAETQNRIDALQEAFANTPGHDGTRAEAFKVDMVNIHASIQAERKMAMSGLVDLIEAAGDKKGAGLGRRLLMLTFNTDNPRMTADIIREVYALADGHTGNPEAKAAARAWLDVIGGLRKRFNAAGGDVGKLEYGYLPRLWDTAKIRKAGVDGFVDRMFSRVDRSRLLHDDGARMNDDEVRVFLREAYKTLSTEGLNKQEPGAFHGTGARANRGSDHRQIHLADGMAELQTMADFGRGSLYDAMMGHVSGMVRDIVLVERYGPDANANARLQMDLAVRADGATTQKPVGTLSIRPQTYWDMLTGKTGTPADESLARNLSMIRNLQTAAKLGGAVISSITDLGTLAITTGYNRLPYWKLVRNIASQGKKETRDFMSAHGMIAESLADSLNRWSGDHLGSNWSGKMANGVMRLSLLNAWTDGLRQGFVLTMNAGLARMAKKQWADLAEFDRSRLSRAGITEADWSVLNGVAPTMFKGRELLTPQAIKQAGSDELAAKVFGFIHDESEFAVVNPDMRTRAITTMGGLQAGTWSGEIARTAMQFKSFPIAMMTRHWGRLLEGDHGADGAPMLANRTVYGFALMATLTGLGAIAVQEKQMLAGKDPIDMTKPRFWAKAIAQGGAWSVAGDLFLLDPASSGSDMATNAIKTVLGPSAGTVTDLAFRNIAENMWQAAEGKDTHWEAELFGWAKAQTPGANLWWVKPMVDHGFANALNEQMSPGYLARVQRKAQQDWQQQYWWAPRDAMPSRAPDLAGAFGQ